MSQLRTREHAMPGRAGLCSVRFRAGLACKRARISKRALARATRALPLIVPRRSEQRSPGQRFPQRYQGRRRRRL